MVVGIETYLRNNTGSDILIEDLGLTVPASTTLDVTGQLKSIDVLRHSDDLRTHIASGDIDIFGVTGTPLPLAQFDLFQLGAQVGFGSHWVTPTSIIDLNDNVKSLTVSGTTLSGAITLSGVGLVTVDPTTDTINISAPSAASIIQLSGVSGTLTANLATLSGAVSDNLDFLLEEVIPNISSPATTVQQGFSEQDNTLSSTSSTTFQQKLRLTADTALVVTGTSPEPFRVQWYWEWGFSGANAEFNGQLELDDFDVIAEINWRPTATSSDDYQSSSGYEDMLLSSGTHTFDLDYRSTAGNKTARIRRARLALIPLTLSTIASIPPLRGNP